MVNVCWQCGDVGLNEAFLYCIECKSAGIHSYCLEEIPEDLTAEIEWLCEDCRSKSPNSVGKAKLPTPVSPGILDHGSFRAQIGLNCPCQEIGSVNDHLVSSQDHHIVSNVGIGSSVKLDNIISNDYERNTLSCAIGGTIISSAHFKQNGDDKEEFDNENSKSERPMLSDKDALDDSQLLLEAQGTNLHLIGGTCELGSGLKEEDESVEYDKESSKRRELILPDKDELNSFNHLINGEGTNFSLAGTGTPGASVEPSDSKVIIGRVGSSACCKQEDDKIEEYEKGESKSIGKILPTTNFHPLIDGQDTNIPFVVKSLPSTSFERCERHTIGRTSSNDGNELKAQSKNKRNRRRSRKRRFFPPFKGGRDNFQPGQGNNIPLVAKRIHDSSIMVSEKRIIGRISTSDTLGAIKSSVCFELKKGKSDGYDKEKSESKSLILPTEHEVNNLHSVIDRGDASNFAAKREADTSVKPSDRHAKNWIDTKAQINIPCQLTSPSLSFGSPIWRGCFNINKAELGPLRAHLSSGARSMVCNFARKLPLVLHMQKLPRLVAWPNSFKVSPPTVDNIALYFFPESDRAETVLDNLVDDFINKDLMVRFEFDEVELLVFSSFMLPREHQMLSGKYYAWGVFKPRSAKISSLPADSHTAYQEINDFTSRRSSVRRGEGTACEEGKLQTLCRKSSMHVELLWHKEERLGDGEKKCELKMSKTYTLELTEVAEKGKES